MVDTPSIPEVVDAEVERRTEAIAAHAAAQVDQANKDAEAIARAAQQSEHVARVNELEGRIGTWKSDLETRLEAQKTEMMAMIEASQASILSKLPQPPPVATVVETPPLVTSPTVHPEGEGGEQGSKSKPTEPPEEKTPGSSPGAPAARKRAVL